MRHRPLIGLVTCAAAMAVVVFAWTRVVPSAAMKIPTARIQRGEVQVKVYTTGELRAARAVQIVAPPIGGNLQIVSVAQPGQRLTAGERVVEFDPAEQEFQLEQSRFDLAQAEQDIVKSNADAAVQAAEDELALLQQRFAVRRAELDASANELLSAVDAEKNLMLLEEARRQLAQLEKDVQSHREASRATTNGLIEKRNKAQLSVQVAQRNIDNLSIKAPFDGFVVLRENLNAFGGPIFGGMPIPEFRAGDSVFSGAAIADLVDTSRLEVSARVPEGDRANVDAGQPTDVSVDALPGLTLRGAVRAIGSVAARSPFGNDVVRQFDVLFAVNGITEGVRPGMTAQMTIAGATFSGALFVPRQAIFETGGKSVVYLRSAASFDAREVRVRTRTESVAIIESDGPPPAAQPLGRQSAAQADLQPGAEVALIDPKASSGARPRGPSAAPGGGRGSP